MATTTKACVTCGEEKALSAFGRVGAEEGARKDCKDCANAASKKSRNKNKGVTDGAVVALVKGQLKANNKVASLVKAFNDLSDADKALFSLGVRIS